MIRVSILLSRKTGTFSEILIKNLGHLRQKKKGHILKIRFSTELLPPTYIHKCSTATTQNPLANVHYLFISHTFYKSMRG
jgi:hypothetical protein